MLCSTMLMASSRKVTDQLTAPLYFQILERMGALIIGLTAADVLLAGQQLKKSIMFLEILNKH
jgi:hypothetical protein